MTTMEGLDMIPSLNLQQRRVITILLVQKVGGKLALIH